MQRDISALQTKEYDLIVIGGGIFGICTAWDAVLRGLSVALVEKGDFGHATSASHFKLVHGGIRYLQHADFQRVRESNRERNILLRLAPHLVHPVPFVFPTYGHGLQGKEAMTVGLQLYDLLTLDRNRGIQGPGHQIPPGRVISRDECLRLFPHLDKQGLTGAAIFYECQMYNPTRLSLAYLRAAVEAGVDALNYVQATGLLRRHDQITGIEAQDLLRDDAFEIRGRVVINAAGPWADQWFAQTMGNPLQPRPAFSRDAWFSVPRTLVSTKFALALPAKSKDSDALLSRGHRHLFLIPWRESTLVGVWHVAHSGGPEDYQVTEADLREFLHEVNSAYPALELMLDDIALWHAGLILYGEDDPQAKSHSFGKRSLVIDHAQRDRLQGLITVIGVRYTIARGVAEQVVDLVFHKLGKIPPPTKTAVTPLYGGKIDIFEAFCKEAERQRPATVNAAVMPSLLKNYGAAYAQVLRYVTVNPAWGATLDNSHILQAEVIHAVREEMAHKLSDVVFRRTELGTAGHPGETALQMCAQLVGAELGWDEQRRQRELAEVEALFPARRRVAPLPPAPDYVFA